MNTILHPLSSARRPTLASSAAERVGVGVMLGLPGLLTLYLGFNSGGFFPDVTGFVAVVLLLGLVVRVTLAERPFAGVSAATLVAAALLSALAVLTLLSGLWSSSPARGLLEFDRTLLYLIVLALVGSLPVTFGRLAWAVRGFAAAVIVICVAGLVSRLAPDLLPTAADVATERLSYPVSYWNGLGLLAGVGCVLCFHLASERSEPAWVRTVAAAALPALATALLLTFSRGAIGVVCLALPGYLLVARSLGSVLSLLAVGPPTALAIVWALRAELIASPDYTTRSAIAEGHELALLVVLAVFVAAGAQTFLARFELRGEMALSRRRRGRRASRRGASLAAGALIAVCVVAGALALDVPTQVSRQYAEFVKGGSSPAETRERLTSASNNGRLEQWRVAVETFRDSPVAGAGAGTFQISWARDRREELEVVDGHSLYLETLAELGVLGLLALSGALATLVVAVARRARGRARGVYGAILVCVLAWIVHAGIDWDWELPAVTSWVLALGGLAIAKPPMPDEPDGPAPLTRIVAAIGCLLLALTPALVALSQQELDRSVGAYRKGDCATTADGALASISLLSVRPQPFEMLAYCNVRAGLPDLAVEAMRKAHARDSNNWEYEYGLALTRAAAGRDPRAQAAQALLDNPRSGLAQKALLEFGTTDSPREWRRRALRARLPIAP